MSIIKTENICKSFGTVEVLKNVSLTVEPGEVIVIIGPSGAGKSTYLRSLNRLGKSTSGKIWIDDRLIEDRVNGHNQIKIHQKERAAILLEMGMVFQRFNLFPHKTALQNVMLAPMTVKGVPADKAREKAVQLLEQVGLGDKASGLGMPKDAVTAAIEAAGFDARIRPEALTLEDFAKIQQALAR